jgi:hypothetical protein
VKRNELSRASHDSNVSRASRHLVMLQTDVSNPIDTSTHLGSTISRGIVHNNHFNIGAGCLRTCYGARQQ